MLYKLECDALTTDFFNKIGSMQPFAALCTNGSTADKPPFSIWIIVEIATHLLSTLCANHGHANYVAIGANVPNI